MANLQLYTYIQAHMHLTLCTNTTEIHDVTGQIICF